MKHNVMKQFLNIIAPPERGLWNILDWGVVLVELAVLALALVFLKGTGIVCMVVGGIVIWIIEDRFNRLKEKNVEDKK